MYPEQPMYSSHHWIGKSRTDFERDNFGKIEAELEREHSMRD